MSASNETVWKLKRIPVDWAGYDAEGNQWGLSVRVYEARGEGLPSPWRFPAPNRLAAIRKVNEYLEGDK